MLDVPADMTPGLYFVAAADSSGAGESSWKQALEVLAPAYQVANEEDPSCGGAGTECVHPIGFGQVVVGTWGEAGDVDYYYVTMGAGTTFDVSVSRVDTTLSPLHPDAADPELFVVDPDGVVDGTIGYANDTSADDTDARIVGYTAIKSGVYTVAARSLKGTGDYTVALTRTGTRTPSSFETLPYGARSVNVVETPGEPSQATLQAVVLDRFGDPVAGAFPQWQVVAGDAAATTHWYTASSGIAQFQAEMGTADQLDLQASFPWVYGQGGGTVIRAAAPVAQLRRPTAVVGTVEIDTLGGAVVDSRFATPATIERVRASIAREGAIPAAKPVAPGRDLGDGFTTSSLTSCGGDVQRVTRLAIPPGATSVEDLELEILDELGSAIPDDEITGLVVHERRNLQVRLIAHCSDGQGGTFDAPLPGARVALTVTGGDPSWAGGIVESGGSVCNPGVVEVDAELNPVTYEGGTRAVCVLVDENLEATFAATEVVTASAGIRTKTAAGTWTSVRKKVAVDVALEHDTPRTFHFYQPHDLVTPKGYAWDGCYDPSEPTGTQCIHGPAFTLLDEYNNVVVLWGRTDSVLHNEPATDEVYLSNPGTWGVAPWGVIRYYPDRDPTRYYPIEYPVSTTSPFFYGHSDWTVCVKTGEDAPLDVICSSFSVDNGTAYNILKVLLPWVADEPDLNADDYIDVMEPLLEESYRVAPGQPLRFYPSGKLAIFRVDPVRSDDYQPHSVLLDDVPVKIWVSGPHSQPGMVASHQLRPDGPFVPRKADDVEIWTGSLVIGVRADTNFRCCWDEGVPPDTYQVCEDGHTRYYYDLDQGSGATSLGEATLIASTDPPATLVDDCTTPETELGLIGEELPAFAITKAPSEPGWYTIVVETDDPRFIELSANDPVVWPSHNRVLYPMSFLVTGVEILDAEYQRTDPIPIEGPTTVHVRYISSGGTEGVASIDGTLATKRPDGTAFAGPTPIVLSRIANSSVFLGQATLEPATSPQNIELARAAAEGSVVQAPGGPSEIEAVVAPGTSKEAHGSCGGVLPLVLRIQYLDESGQQVATSPVVRTVREPDPDDATHSLHVEECKIRVAAVLPGTDTVDESASGYVALKEQANLALDGAEGKQYSYRGEKSHTATELPHYGTTDPCPTCLSEVLELGEGGVSQAVVLRSLAGPRKYPTGAQAVAWYALLVAEPTPSGRSQGLTESEPALIPQWADQGSVSVLVGATDVTFDPGESNGHPDWLEGVFWDRIVGLRASGDQTASAVGQSVLFLGHHMVILPEEVFVYVDPGGQTVRMEADRLKTDDDRFDGPAPPNLYHGLEYTARNRLSTSFVHEARHCWQHTIVAGQTDGDEVPDAVADSYAAYLLDAANTRRTGGQNPEFDFEGPSVNDGLDPDGYRHGRDAKERDAIRWAMRQGYSDVGSALDCAGAGSLVSLSADYGIYDLGNLPIGVQWPGGLGVFAKAKHYVRYVDDGGAITEAISGLLVEFSVETDPVPGGSEPGNPQARVVDVRDGSSLSALALSGKSGWAFVDLVPAPGLNIFSATVRDVSVDGDGMAPPAPVCSALTAGKLYFLVRGF